MRWPKNSLLCLLLCVGVPCFGATKREPWCGQLLKKPLTGKTLTYVIEKRRIIEELQKRLESLDIEDLSAKTRQLRTQWIHEKRERHNELLNEIEDHIDKTNSPYLIVRGILDAHNEAIETLGNYLKELNDVKNYTRFALVAVIVDLVGAMIFPGAERFLTFLSVAGLAIHSHQVADVRVARAAVETEFVRIKELLQVFPQSDRIQYPMLKEQLPFSVLAFGLFDAFQIPHLLTWWFEPVIPIEDIFSFANGVWLSKNSMIIRESTTEVREVYKALNQLGERLERELFEALVPPERNKER